jgi:pimeloyl-ACP methyl ester carboxylesterase
MAVEHISRFGRTVGMVSAAVGVVATGAAVGLAAERFVVGRSLRRAEPGVDGPWRGEPTLGALTTVKGSDRVKLMVESMGPDDAPTVVVFSHGFALDRRSWWYQWRDLPAHIGPTVKLVRWDHRGHGESGKGTRRSASIDRTGDDLGRVIEAVAPGAHQRVILVGHSMGGMSIMTLARLQPKLFAKKIIATSLIATSAGAVGDEPPGFSGWGGDVFNRIAPGLLHLMAREPEFAQRSVRWGADLAYVLTKRYSFAGDVDPRLVKFVASMVTSTAPDTLAEFYPLFDNHLAMDVFPTFSKMPVVVMVGEEDRLTPPAHSRAMAAAAKNSQLVLIPASGHLPMLEYPDLVTAHLAELIRSCR